MSEIHDQPASWRGFFTGCFVLIAIFGGIAGTFLHFKGKSDQRVAAIQRDIMQPYWTAVKAGDFEKAHSLRSPRWQEKNTPEALAQAYTEAREKHGELKEAYIHVANEFFEPGQEGQACRVESIYVFGDGARPRIVFTLRRADEQAKWVIDESAPGAHPPLGDGPY